MKRILLVFMIAFCFFQVGPLAAQNLQWAKGLSYNNSVIIGIALTTDAAGNIYTTGKFSGTMDFVYGPDTLRKTSLGDYDIFVMKSDSLGNFKWVKTFGSTAEENVVGIVLDQHENIFLAGSYRGTTDFDPGPGLQYRGAASNSSLFQLKLDSNGNFVRVFTYNTSNGWAGTTGPSDLVIDNQQNLLMSGTFNGATDFDPSPSTLSLSGSSGDAFIQKLDSNDNLVWAVRMGGASIQIGRGIQTDSLGNVYLTGYFYGTCDFDPGPGAFNVTRIGSHDAFLLKLNPQGQFLWVRTFGDVSQRCFGTKIAIGASNEVYLVGNFEGSPDFDPGAGVAVRTSNGMYDMFVVSYDASGNFRWVNSFGDTQQDNINDIEVGPTGNIHTVGSFIGTTDFDPSPSGTAILSSTSTNYDGFVNIFDTLGNYIWAGKFGGNNWDEVYAIEILPNGQSLSTGRYNGPSDFDPSSSIYNVLPASSTVNYFLMKLGSCQASRFAAFETICDSIVNQGITYDTSGFYSLIYSNYLGCDSFVELSLTVNYSNFSTQTYDTCAPFYLNGYVYNSSGIYSQILTNNVGCDSILNANITLRQNTNITIVDSSCSSYSWFGYNYTQSGTFSHVSPSPNGCDSIQTLHLTILGTRNVHTINSCTPYLFSGQLYSVSGYYEWFFTNIYGCDSIEILDLHILPIDTGITFNGIALEASQPSGPYQWLDCNNNFLPIAAANSRYFIPLGPGSYCVEISNGACLDTTSCYTITLVDLEAKNDVAIQVFPNPNDGFFRIQMPNEIQNWSYKIFDPYGKILMDESVLENETKLIDFPFPAGIYFLSIQFEDRIKVFKIVKE